MFLRVLYGLVALLVFCNAQVLGKKWDEDPENPNSWINIDSERNNDVVNDQPYAEYTEKDGSGSGMLSTDDDDLLQGSGSGSGSGGPSVTDEETEIDEPPRVNAGPDVILRWPQRTTVLCGNATTDDRGITKFLWIKAASSPPLTMSGATDVCVSLSGLMIGEYTFTLQVTDSGGNKGTDLVRVMVEVSAATTIKPVDKTACQQLRDVSKHLLGSYIPRCTETGEFAGQQCRGHESTGTCWCADIDGAEIPGTNVSPPPDCELGTNLQPCVFKLVQQMRRKLLGTFQPKCSLSGDFEAVQCEGSSCFCVDQKTGVRVHGTEVFKPDQPECDGKRPQKPMVVTSTTTTATTTKTTAATKPWTTTRQPTVPRSTPLPDLDDDEEVDEVDSEGKEITTTQKPITTTQKPQTTESGPHRELNAADMMSQPGILAAIIGGSVVLLLCAILLVMFVVYRMRKKDEGSYALDEPKKMPNYSYQRAPDKEFYA